MAGINKVWELPGDFGSASLVEAGGKVTFGFSVNKSLGGGASAGVLTLVESLAVTGNGAEAVDAGLLEAEKKWPGITPVVMLIKPEIDALVATL